MGNSLPKNPTRQDYLVFAGKVSKSDPERAIEIYLDVARQLRFEKKWEESIMVLIDCSRLQSSTYKAKTLVDIANIYRKLETKDKYVEYLGEAITIFHCDGSFSNCGKYAVVIAEEHEKSGDHIKALDYYTRAVDYYEMADMENNCNKYTIKMAMLSALENSTLKSSITMFEKLATSYSENKLTTYSAPGYLLKAGLCRILAYCQELDTFTETQCAIDQYSIAFPIFEASREANFLNNLLNAVEEKDVNTITSNVVNYDAVSSIDDWTVGIILKIKKSILENDLR
jgi:alpha-soluble NSF attachment protein